MKLKFHRLIGVISCFIMLFAFCVPAKAMNFDAEVAYNSIYVIYSGNSMGSGFAIGTNTIITNAHVVVDQDDVYIYTYEGDYYDASVYLYDEDLDIAVLSVDNSSFAPLSVGDSSSIKVGDDIYAIGAPKAMSYTLTKGVISNKARNYGTYDYIQIDAAINSGNSGGPLINDNGEVIGVNTLKMSDAEGIGLAIPIKEVVNFLTNNGVSLDDDNHVVGELEYTSNGKKKTGNGNGNGNGNGKGNGNSNGGSNGDFGDFSNDKGTANDVGKYVFAIAALAGVAIFSIVLNIYQGVTIKNIKKQSIIEASKSSSAQAVTAKEPDPSERTDFEIDTWE